MCSYWCASDYLLFLVVGFFTPPALPLGLSEHAQGESNGTRAFIFSGGYLPCP